MLFLIVIFIFFPKLNSAQDDSQSNQLYVPINIHSAIEQGIRSDNGKPGSNYWQNHSEYEIDAQFDPDKKLLQGNANIIYHNESPDTLTRIVLRMYQDIFKKEAARDWPFNPDGLTEGLIINKLVVDNVEVELKNNSDFRRAGTIASCKLSTPLAPESSVAIKIEWSYLVSGNRLRTGVYDSTTFFIAYWYPEIAVYDDIDGWDLFNYTGTQEFYNDFSSFDIKISLPNNFGVWGTGELQNPEDVLTEKFFKRYKEALVSNSVVKIITNEDLQSGTIFNFGQETNTWHFKSENSTAFAFGLSDHYLWDGMSVITDSINQKRVFIDAAYRIESEDFPFAVEMSEKVINFFSSEFPGVKFPFLCQTIFNGGTGGGGMEHSMIVNNGTSSSKSSAEALIAHEIAHQYFPFFVGTNEKKYAFMDEGWAVLFTILYQEKFSESARLKTEVLSYQNFAGKELDIPPMIPSVFLSSNSYRAAAYTRPALAYYYLRDFLGEEIFQKAVFEFINRWQGKHPLPYDLFNTFNEVADQNLNWYWKAWFFESGYPELELNKVFQDDDEIGISVWNNGKIPIPIRLKLIYEDNSSEEIYNSAGVWKDGNNTFLIFHETDKILKEVVLGSDTIPDTNSENNIILIH